MDDYLNPNMSEALKSMALPDYQEQALRQILMREKAEKGNLNANAKETQAQYDDLMGELSVHVKEEND